MLHVRLSTACAAVVQRFVNPMRFRRMPCDAFAGRSRSYGLAAEGDGVDDYRAAFADDEDVTGHAATVAGGDVGFGAARSPSTLRGRGPDRLGALRIRGHAVRIDADGRLSLDDLQRCAGLKAGCSNYRPRVWVHTPRGHAAIEASLRALREGGNALDPLVTRLGKGGSTYAVVDAALDYADWLDLRDRLSRALEAWIEAAFEA